MPLHGKNCTIYARTFFVHGILSLMRLVNFSINPQLIGYSIDVHAILWK